MSDLATKLADATLPPADRVRRGPANMCHPLYGDGDLDDWQAVEKMRAQGYTWREVQAAVDNALGITQHITADQFRYHWRRRCWCWTEGDRL